MNTPESNTLVLRALLAGLDAFVKASRAALDSVLEVSGATAESPASPTKRRSSRRE